jgi:hypothetical protein
MSQEAHCKGCRYWHATYDNAGYCRRHTPTAFFIDYGSAEDRGFTTQWPQTLDSAWCGEFEPKGAPSPDRFAHFPSEVTS